MPTTLDWGGLALRLALTLFAGGLIGLNRGEQGRPAGLRTTMLVCLAAALAMIQVNLLLPMAGKAQDSFVTNDLMRLPLGILTGVGFIGGGAILRKGALVRGVTTAATLWIVTVIGLCFGGGQLWLGTIGTALAVFVLWVLKRAEARLPQRHRAVLELRLDSDQPTVEALCERLSRDGYAARVDALALDAEGHRQVHLDLHWTGRVAEMPPPPCLSEIFAWPGVDGLKWASRAAPPA